MIQRWLCIVAVMVASATAWSQTKVKPTIEYGRSAMTYEIGGIEVTGAPSYDQYLLISLSGLSVGQTISLPGEEVSQAIRRFWRHGLFGSARIECDSIVGRKAYLNIILSERPRVSQINYNGVKKSEREDLEAKLGLIKEQQMTPNMVDRTKKLAKRYFDDKGYKNAVVEVLQRDDVSEPGKIIVDINIDKKSKVRVNSITLTGVEVLKENQIKGTTFKSGALKKTKEKHRFANWFRSKKFIEEKYKEDLENVVALYNEHGYRDAYIVEDSVVPHDDKTVDVYIHVHEGQQYFVRNIEWVGNTVYNSEGLDELLRMKRGDVYNMTHIQKRTKDDEDAIMNLYYNNGYVFSDCQPTEINIEGDSIDLEMRITEGTQATISHVNIIGNDRVYENVVRRELRNKPGDLFSRDALMRSYREIAAMGHFDAESIQPDVKPDPVNGTVDVTWGLTSKSNDQVEFSLGYGQTGVIGKIGLKFSNFCMSNLFRRDGLRRAVIPQGNGETFSISGQTNGRYYQSYSVQYLNPWFGGKRPNMFSLSAFFSKMTDVSDNYYNSSYYNSYYNYLYGMGNSYNNYYENFYDPDKYIKIWGLTAGWGKRLRWPDDYFQFMADLSYTRYNLKSWEYFLVSNGSCNNIALNLSLSRNSIDNPIFPRSGSEFLLQGSLTPPYSLWDGINYEGLANNYQSATYQKELQTKYKWIEYHKWKFKLRTYTALTGHTKCPVLMTRVEFGLLGSYNKYKKSPFETYYMGGDGTSGYSSTYATETIGLRGYDNGSLTPRGYSGYAYSRFTLELRYPLMLGASTNIYALTFVEGGNAWNEAKKFNPFDMKRSAGAGVRIFLPMVGLLGIDWAYGFDKLFGSRSSAGSQFHFILGQEF